MIDENDIFNEIKDNTGLWCDTKCVGADLAAAAGMAITNKFRAISVVPGAVAELWPWIENTNIKIISRFMLDNAPDDDAMSNLASRISTSFHDGASGAIIFVRFDNLKRLTSELSYVRDDLFFNKTLSIGLDINEIDFDEWGDVFQNLQSVHADSLTLFLSRDDGDKSDFVGRVYAMLNTNMGDWHGVLHFMLGKNYARADQVYRLTEQLRFNMIPKMLFWINN